MIFIHAEADSDDSLPDFVPDQTIPIGLSPPEGATHMSGRPRLSSVDESPDEISVYLGDIHFYKRRVAPWSPSDHVWSEFKATKFKATKEWMAIPSWTHEDPPPRVGIRSIDEHRSLTKDRVRRIFLESGFEIKPGLDDLKPYVYEAAGRLMREVVGFHPSDIDAQEIARLTLSLRLAEDRIKNLQQLSMSLQTALAELNSKQS